MKNWKTTLFGFLALVPQIIDANTSFIPPKWAGIASAVSAAIAFFFATDKK